MEDKYIVAIEIGSSKIRGALASVKPGAPLNIISVQEERLSDCVRYGQVRNIDETAKSVSNICKKLQAVHQVEPRKIKSVYVGISGLSVGSEKASYSDTFPTDTPITTEIVDELKDRVASVSGQKTVFHIVPVKYTVDNEDTMKPVGRSAHSIKGTFEIITGNTGLRSNIERAIKDRCGYAISDYIVTPLAEADAVLTHDEKELGCMLVDFGAETTTTVIFKGNTLRSMVTLPIGSHNITRDLMALNNTEEQAEALKRSIGISNIATDAPQFMYESASSDATNYISARAKEIAANIIARIEFAGYKIDDLPKGIVLIGGGARLKGFQTLLADFKNIPVRLGSIPHDIRMSEPAYSADDAIDVISILMAAAQNPNAESSLTDPEPVTTQATPAQESSFFSEEEKNQSRIGRQYNNDDDYKANDRFDDDDDDDDDNNRNRRKKSKVNPFSTLIDTIKNKITNLTQDNIEDNFYVDDDNDN